MFNHGGFNLLSRRHTVDDVDIAFASFKNILNTTEYLDNEAGNPFDTNGAINFR